MSFANVMIDIACLLREIPAHEKGTRVCLACLARVEEQTHENQTYCSNAGIIVAMPGSEVRTADA